MDPISLLLNCFYIVLSILLLWKGSGWVVDSASKLAYSLGVSDLVIGLTVVAIGTSAPEFAVTIQAAMIGKTDISVSNVVGSNIFNLGFILGGTASVYAIATTPKLVYRDGMFLIFVTLLLSFFFFDPFKEGDIMVLDRVEGAILIALLVIYMVILFIKREVLEEEIAHGKFTLLNGVMLVVGIAGVVGGGHLLVDSASSLAHAVGISDWVIGVTIVAAGTSTPELATSIMALVRKKHGMAIGNLIGSDLFNLLGVLGLAGLLNGALVISNDAKSSMVMLVCMMMLVVYFMRSGWKISRLEGASLVLINLIRWTFDFMGKTS